MSVVKTFATWMATITALVSLAPSFAGAQGANHLELLQRIESLETERVLQLRRIESLETERVSLQSQFASYTLLGGGKDLACDGCSQVVCGCKDPAWVASYEITALRPYVSNITLGPGFSNEFGIGHRFIIGRDGGMGLGVRARY